VQREAENGLEFARKAKFGYVVDLIIGQLRLIRTLRGLTPSLSSLNDAEFDEGRQHLEADPHLVFATCWYRIRKLQAHFYAGDYASALAAASKAAPLSQTPGHFEPAEYHFYDALARAAHYDSAPRFSETARHWLRPRSLASGGRDLDAMHLYEQAIRSARENGFIQNEAIAHEVAARFYAARAVSRQSLKLT
jgi:tetratricopeptide (TPR) repeat protein